MTLTVLDIIKRAMRLHGTLASGDTPAAPDTTDFLLALNTMKRAMFGTLIGPRLSPQSVTGASGQAERGGEYQVGSGGGIRPITLTGPVRLMRVRGPIRLM